jgi:putative flippase GtrA
LENSHDRQVAFRFLVSGASAAVLNLLSRYIFSQFIDFRVSVIAAHLVGMGLAFQLFRKWVFAESGSGLNRDLSRFIIVNLGGLVITWVVSVSLLTYVFTAASNVEEFFCHVVGMSITTLSSFYGHRMYTFKSVSSPR